VSKCIDLTGVTQLEQPYASQLDDIAEEIRKPYIELISQIADEYGDNLDWWVTPLACRNTYVCNLFLYLCQLVLIIRVAEKDGINEVIVSSSSLASTLRSFLPSTILVKTRVTKFKWVLSTILISIYRLLGVVYKCIMRICAAKLAELRNAGGAVEPDYPVIIIDTVMYENSVQHGIFKDRHYPGLIEELDANSRRKIFWAPYFYRVNNFSSIFNKMSECDDNFLLAEDYLHISDYLYALGNFIRVKAPKRKYIFEGVEITKILHEVFFDNLINTSSIEALLRHRFTMRLANTGIQVDKVIEWFENQEIDHGAIAGWRRYFPSVPILGYQGFFASQNYMCMFPISVEKELNLIPQTVAVLGNDYISPVKEFCPDLNVTIAPGFRFNSIWLNSIYDSNDSYFTILVPLPIMKSDYISIMEMINKSLPLIVKSCTKPLRFLIKQHPSADSSCKLTEFFYDAPSLSYELISGDIEMAFNEANLVISAASSTCMESVVRGIPVIIIAKPGHLTQNTILNTVDKRLWDICYFPDDFTDTVVKQVNLNIRINEFHAHYEYSWENILTMQPTAKHILDFLDINDKECAGETERTKQDH